MLKSEIQVGKTYLTAACVRLKILEIVENESRSYYSRFQDKMILASRANTRYRCLNIATNRENIVKGAAKFVREV